MTGEACSLTSQVPVPNGALKVGRRKKYRKRRGGFLRQASLFCPACGCNRLYARGLCRSCYNAADHSRRCFSGLRKSVLERDDRQCRVCPAPTRVVHHRRPGINRLDSLISLCPACHAVVTRLQLLDRLLPEFLVLLWREQHPHAPEQLLLPWLAEQGENIGSSRPGPGTSILRAEASASLLPQVRHTHA